MYEHTEREDFNHHNSDWPQTGDYQVHVSSHDVDDIVILGFRFIIIYNRKYKRSRKPDKDQLQHNDGLS
jgi:hypothetical protein